MLNYLQKVSKYDLDRANLCMADIQREKNRRRHANAMEKRQSLEGV